jgi:hypothetical protein
MKTILAFLLFAVAAFGQAEPVSDERAYAQRNVDRCSPDAARLGKLFEDTWAEYHRVQNEYDTRCACHRDAYQQVSKNDRTSSWTIDSWAVDDFVRCEYCIITKQKRSSITTWTDLGRYCATNFNADEILERGRAAGMPTADAMQGIIKQCDLLKTKLKYADDCRKVYDKTIDEKAADITTRESELIKACRELEMYPPPKTD